LYWIGGGTQLFFGVWSATHALLNKRDPRAAFGWSLTCLLIPLGGPFAYLLFGINRVRRRAKRLSGERGESVGSETRADRRPVVGGNAITSLYNGDQAYPAMLADIAASQRRVWLATYIFDTDATGMLFVHALQQARERGVDVRVLVDGFGQLSSFPRVTSKLKAARISHARFLPPRLFPPLLSFNLRNHRKILVVDDDVAYIGGMNISARHVADENGQRKVDDMHFRMRGTIGAQLAEIFHEDWQFAGGEALTAPETPAGSDRDTANTPIRCRTVTDGPDRDLDKLALLIQTIAASTKRSLKIMTPYFLPGRELIGALKSAAARGIDVTVILPAKSDLPYMTWATRKMLWELLQRGVQFYYQPPPFVHTKLIVADDGYALIGSANIDARSLRLNFEIVAEIFDEPFSRELALHFDRTVERSQRVTLEEMDGRSLLMRLRDAIAWLFSPYL
jgi:cardiolipin synthase